MSVVHKYFVTALVLLSACACAEPVYVAMDIDAQVVDADSGQPIEGANVVANWQLEQGMLDGHRRAGQLEVMETVTDKEGRFHFDGFKRFNWPSKGLGNLDPQVIIFKPGYEYQRIFNDYPRAGTRTPGKTRTAAVNGKVVKLKKMNLSEKSSQPGKNLIVYSGLRSDINQLTSFAKDCEWERIPNFILAMDAEKKRVLNLYPQAEVDLIVIDNIHGDRGCSPIDETFEDYVR